LWRDVEDKISFLTRLHTLHETACRENEHLGLAMECLHDYMFETKVSLESNGGELLTLLSLTTKVALMVMAPEMLVGTR
jgi:hypothetical protein